MIKLYDGKPIWLRDTAEILPDTPEQDAAFQSKTGKKADKDALRNNTIAWPILKAHNSGDDVNLNIKFDSITSHDITFVGIIQTSIASGMKEFPLPYVLTNCHNSLNAVGGTINEDDHKFGLSAVKKYGGVYVPTNVAVIHSYNREMMSGCGRMILGSDSHTRYGALGTIAIGEGGGELSKQLLKQTYDVKRPQVVGIVLRGEPKPWVGPQDVALSIIKAVFEIGFTQNKIMEFIGPGVASLPIEFRNGIDVMTTETKCLSSIWRTDDNTKNYFEVHQRPDAYKQLIEGEEVCYDGIVEVDLSEIEPSIALPYHPSEVYPIKEVLKNPHDIFAEVEARSKTLFEHNDIVVDMQSKIVDGKVKTDQGIIVGCSGGTYDNLLAASQIVKGKNAAQNGYSFSCYAGSQPIYLDLLKKGAIADLVEAGAIIKPSFCGPCFGAGDTPANNEFSIRHATRNFPNREGSKPGEGQISMVALMDARSIAATAINGGYLTSAEDVDWEFSPKPFVFDKGVYDRTVVDRLGKADPEAELVYGPNIKPWPEMPALTDDLLLVVSSHIDDPVTTTDELIPSGETSSYRSNPHRLAEFTLSRKDPAYVAHAKNVQTYEVKREKGNAEYYAPWLKEKLEALGADPIEEIGIGSAIFANSPGDGSAREQAASNQKVLGGWANFAKEYATKRYRSNLINWGIMPFLVKDGELLPKDAIVFVPNIRKAIIDNKDEIAAYVLFENEDPKDITFKLGGLTDNEREILLAGCLINFNRNNAK